MDREWLISSPMRLGEREIRIMLMTCLLHSVSLSLLLFPTYIVPADSAEPVLCYLSYLAPSSSCVCLMGLFWEGNWCDRLLKLTSITEGTARDLSLLIDLIGAYVFPKTNRKISCHLALGVRRFCGSFSGIHMPQS